MIISWCYWPFLTPSPTLLWKLHQNLNKLLMADCEIPNELSECLCPLPESSSLVLICSQHGSRVSEKYSVALLFLSSPGYILFNQFGNKAVVRFNPRDFVNSQSFLLTSLIGAWDRQLLLPPVWLRVVWMLLHTYWGGEIELATFFFLSR